MKPINHLSTMLTAASLLTLSLLAAPLVQGQGTDAPSASKLIVWIDDIPGQFDLNNEFIREQILESAFHSAANGSELKREYEVVFYWNQALKPKSSGVLLLRVLSWNISIAGFFDCTVSAQYRSDEEGSFQYLGTFHGSRSSIDVVTRFDVGDHFREVAEHAFEEAISKMKEI